MNNTLLTDKVSYSMFASKSQYKNTVGLDMLNFDISEGQDAIILSYLSDVAVPSLVIHKYDVEPEGDSQYFIDLNCWFMEIDNKLEDMVLTLEAPSNE